jgi:AcrR family transcriptional regulator
VNVATQEERRQATREAILVAAHRQFGERGYGNVTIDQIAAEAKVAKGAIYHHFTTKADVFEAVLRDVAAAIVADVQTALDRQTDVLTAIQAGNRAFFASCAKPLTAQIFLRDGPSVLGWSRWRRIDADNFGGMVKAGVRSAMALGVIAERPIDPLVSLMLGAITEAAISCADEDDFSAAAEAYVDALNAMFRGL